MPTPKGDSRGYIDGKQQVEPLDVTIRKTYAQTKALFIVTKNLQLEVQELRTALAKTNDLFLALLADPQTREQAEAVARDLRHEKFKK